MMTFLKMLPIFALPNESIKKNEVLQMFATNN